MYVVGDRKTPAACGSAATVARRSGLDCVFMDVEAQTQLLRRHAKFGGFVPWNSDNRRNLGFLAAVEDGAEVVVSIDDDNFPVDEDFIGGHAVVGRTIEAPTVSAEGGWHNVFGSLDWEPKVLVWPRGYPYSRRVVAASAWTVSAASVHMNTGLWLGDPDVDAVTRIAIHPMVRSFDGRQVLLAPDTYSPVNTQNTAVHRSAMPAYYYVVMHQPMHGSRLNRFGDIWSGFFAQKCAKTLGYSVSFGHPLVEQVRNVHDLFVDLREEFWGIVLTDLIASWITAVDLSGSDYSSVYGDLADKLLAFINGLDHPHVNQEVRDYFALVNGAMHAWLGSIRSIL